MVPRTLPLVRLSIYLSKPGVTDPDEILKDRRLYTSLPVKAKGKFLGVVYIKESEGRTPDWLAFLRPGLDDDLRDLRLTNSAASAVLLVQRGDQVFALAFGYGRYMLNLDALDHRFGLRCTLNALDPDRIRSLDRKTFERVQRQTREQVSQDSSLAAFQVDVDQDLLRSVTGSPEDETLGHRFSGRDALTAAVRVNIDGVPDLLDRYLALQAEETYKKNFAWVDRISQVVDPGLKTRLDEALVDAIRAGEAERIWMAAPDILDWSAIEGFRYRTSAGAETHPHLDLATYLADTGRAAALDTRHLSSDRIICVTPGEVDSPTWTLRSTLCGELEMEGQRYTLDEGIWYRIDKDFSDEILDAVTRIPQGSVALPPYTHRSEQHYNQKIAERSKGALHLMDRKLVSTGMAYGRIEFCDLINKEGALIHVKRYGGSSTLSHLFNQGFVSAQLMNRDRTFRTSVNEILPEACKFPDPSKTIDPSRFEVAFAIVAPCGRQLRLPFFSMVSLRNIDRSLREMGFAVTLTEIEYPA